MFDFNILVMTHGSFGKSVIESSEMAIGRTEGLQAISLEPGMSPEQLLKEAREKLNGTGKTLVLTDLYGGTPSNVALMLTKSYDLVVISGFNLAMLIEAVIQRQCAEVDSLEELAVHLVKTAQDACRLVRFT